MVLAVDKNKTIIVEAPARLHFGFVDLNGGMGRRFGSLGLTINNIETQLAVTVARQNSVVGIDADRAVRIANRLFDALGLDGGVSIEVRKAIPPHSGLGSGTQMALAVGAAISRLYGIDLNASRIATLLDRGARSGIGIAAFEQGGFIVDGGRRPGGGPPAVISRLEFPEHWRVLLIFDDAQRGLNGEAEREAFNHLPTFPEDESARLCRLLTMQLLPGLAEQRLEDFAAAVTGIQAVIGDYFSPAQGGQRFTSPAVAGVLDWLQANDYSGVGQSSWGPTGFVLIDGETEAFRLSKQLQERFAYLPLRFQVVAGRNCGAVISDTERAQASASEQFTAQAAVPTKNKLS
jgi:beta-RFAP synthase